MRTLTSFALALATAATMAAPSAHAADPGPDLYVPPPTAQGDCPVPAVQPPPQPVARSLTTVFFRQRGAWVQPPRVVTVEPFAGTIPGPPKYIEAQTAWLASSECPPSLGHSPGGSWYDGKTFYYEGTTPQRPDEFMIVVEPSTVHQPTIRKLRLHDPDKPMKFWDPDFPSTPEPDSN